MQPVYRKAQLQMMLVCEIRVTAWTQPCQNTLKFFMNSVSTPVTALQKRKHQDHIEALGISTLPLCVVDQRPTFSSASLCQTTYGKPHAEAMLSFHNHLHSRFFPIAVQIKFIVNCERHATTAESPKFRDYQADSTMMECLNFETAVGGHKGNEE